MHDEHFVIIGNGPAGNQAALTLRQKAPEARITMISAEHERFYRPHLLPDFVAGTLPENEVYAAALEHYRTHRIKLRLGQRVTAVDFSKRNVLLEHKETVRFSGLILAVGGKPRIPEPLLVFRDLMLTFKTFSDARRWIERLQEADSALIVGGDLTSLAVTKALLRLGKQVRFVLNEDAFWPVRCKPEVFQEAAHRLSIQGVDVLEGRKLKSVTRVNENAFEVTVDGERFRVGLVGAFFGLVPQVRFLARSGLTIERGVLVDEMLNTGFEGVYAAGDCAQVYHTHIRDYWVSIGHDNAVNLGRIAALNLLGEKRKAESKGESLLCDDGVRVNTSWWKDF